jgi:tetratricopeptide (TPR) repeat protein
LNAVKGPPFTALILLPQSLLYSGFMRKFLFTIFLVVGGLAPALAGDRTNPGTPPARPAAEVRADQLDSLFARLHKATAVDEAKPLELKIWQLWMASDSPTAEVLLQQAMAAMDAAANVQSLAILDQLVEAYPDYAEAWNKRATLYFNMGRYDNSLADIDRVLALEPRHFGALAGRGMILAHQKKYGEALAAYREALEMNPQLDDVKDAIKALEKIERPI